MGGGSVRHSWVVVGGAVWVLRGGTYAKGGIILEEWRSGEE